MRPKLVDHEHYLPYLASIDESRLYSNYGPLNSRFEARVIEEMFDGVGACVTVSNATIGLMLAISQVKRDGKFAVMPSFTFAAAPLAAQWAGLRPYFIDIDGVSWSQSNSAMQSAVQELGDDIAVVVPYATFGAPIELSQFGDLRTASGSIPVVVDAAASFGARTRGEHFGKGFHGAVVYSFHATKAFGVGEGGLIYSGDEDLVSAIRRAGNFGFGSGRESVTQGLNSKMSEYTAAIALATLDVYPDKIMRRAEIYDTYLDCLQVTQAITAGWQVQSFEGLVPHQFFPVLCPQSSSNDRVIRNMEAHGIQCRTYFSPACHQQPHFVDSPAGSLAVTEDVVRRIVSLPLYEDITSNDIRYIVDSLT